MLELIKDSDKGSEPLDKLRLFLQWYLTTEQEVSRSDLDSFTQALDAAGADTTAVKYVKTVRQLTRMTMNLLRSRPTCPKHIPALRRIFEFVIACNRSLQGSGSGRQF